jgi:hypothetical protein
MYNLIFVLNPVFFLEKRANFEIIGRKANRTIGKDTPQERC